jgi:hypothetical protein
MKSLYSLFAAFLLALPAFADSTPPTSVTEANYEAWLGTIGAPANPFSEYVFAWYQQQRNSPLPAEVSADPDHLYVNVDRPMQETIALENSGDVDSGVTYGLEAYGLLEADIQTVLSAKLFGWGKPVGQASGTTYPVDAVFNHTMRTFAPRWGAGAYYSTAIQTGGGLARDLNDTFSIILQGNANDGYVLYTSFLAPGGDTQTTGHFSIVTIRQAGPGKTEFRQLAFQIGQSYASFGIDFGRKNFGFNYSRVRQGEKGFLSQVMELKATGKITEQR